MLDGFCSIKRELPQQAELTCFLSSGHCHFTLPGSGHFLQVQPETDIKEVKPGTVSLGGGEVCLTMTAFHRHIRHP